MRLPIMRLPILFVVCVVAARPSVGVAQYGGGMGGGMVFGGAAGGPQVQTAPAGATRLYVKTLPPGAQVTLDGTVLGQSDGLFLVPAGTTTVSVQFDGAQPEVRQVEIAEGRITRVEIDAGAARGTPERGMAGGAPSEAAASPIRHLTSTLPPVTPAPLSALDGVLEEPLQRTFDFQETPLREFIRHLEELAGIDVLVDLQSLTDAGVDLDATTVTKRVANGLPLHAVLDMVLPESGLTWIVRDDLLEITTRAGAQERLIVRVHDVSDLAANEHELQTLAELLTSFVAPPTWDTAGGPGAIKPDRAAKNSLVVSQEWGIQRQVAGFLDVLRRLKATPVEKRRPLAAAGYWNAAPTVVAARAALEEPVTQRVDFQECPLRAVAARLSETSGVPIGADMQALTKAGIDLDDATVSIKLNGKTLPLWVVLGRILEGCGQGLTVDVRDEGLVITTVEKTQETMSIAVYPVDQLVGGGRTFGALVGMVEGSVAPQTWDRDGGLASLTAVDGDVPCLVVRQSAAGHRAVHEFLKSLSPAR